MRLTKRSIAVMACIPVAAVAAGCSGSNNSASGNGSGEQAGGQTLVVDEFFDVKTLDPQRCFEFTCTIIDRQAYRSALKFNNDKTPKPVPDLASYKMSPDNKVLTLSVKKGAKFADGSPVTADDIVYTYKRLQGINGNPSFLLAGVTVTKVDNSTVKLTSKTPNPELPYILPAPPLGIVNAKAVKKHGGTTTKADKAQKFLDFHSAGSGPYIIDSYQPKSKIVLTLNPKYDGPKPKYTRVVVRNVEGPTQKVDIQSGTADLAMNMGPDQIDSLDRSKVNVFTTPGTRSIYVFLNQDPSVNKWTANKDFMQGVKLGIDYQKIAKTAGGGAKQLGGIVPQVFLGALKSDEGLEYDPQKAKAKIKASGYDGSAIPFFFPNDATVGGIPLKDLVVPLQAQLKKIGVNITLKPGPSGTAITPYRAGKDAMGMWYWGSDYPDPSDYLVFGPDGNVGVRARWTKSNADPAVLASMKKAESAVSPKERDAAYREFQKTMNKLGPFIPLVEPARNIVTSKKISSVVLNPSATFSFASVK